jgi:hypothetical protein
MTISNIRWIIFALLLSGLGIGFTAAEVPPGWIAAGSAPKDYDFSQDASTASTGRYSALIASKPGAELAGFGTLMQTISAENYKGGRLRLSGYLKTSEATRAQMWMRVDGPARKVASFDNMDPRPVTGTTGWTHYEIVLDVPADSIDIAFGFLLTQSGKVWGDNFKLEKVGSTVPVTTSAGAFAGMPKDPVNVDFEGTGGAGAAASDAQRAPAELERDVSAFISSVIVRSHDQSLARWPLAWPPCLHVEGIEPSERDLVIARIYKIAQVATAPTGGAKCDPNFFIFVTPDPDAMIAGLQKRDPRVFNRRYGVAQVNRFKGTPRPIRVWYNIHIGGRVPNSKMQYDEFRAITEVLVFVDTKRLGNTVNFEQLADYIAVTGLAEVDLDADLGNAPSILRLFSASPDAAKSTLTSWDQGFLYSLYNTRHRDMVQVSEMETLALKYIQQPP